MTAKSLFRIREPPSFYRARAAAKPLFRNGDLYLQFAQEHIPLHDLDLPRKYLAVGASRRLRFPLLDQGEDLLPYGSPNSRGSCRTDSRVETRNRRCPKRALIQSKPLAEPECGAGSFGQRSVSLNGQ